MPRMDGLEVTRRFAGPSVPDPVKVVVATTFDLDEYVHAALGGGAVGFVLEDAGPALLVEAVRAAAVGESLISPAVTVRLLRTLAAPARPTGRPATDLLTARELGLVRLVARGHTNAEIGRELFLSLSTVKAHLSAGSAKLGVRNRVEIAVWAWRNGHVR